MGGTMRLGLQECRLKPGTRRARCMARTSFPSAIATATNSTTVTARKLEAAGLVISAKSMDDALVEMIELPDHPWFLACQCAPGIPFTPRDGHPLFIGFIRAAREYKAQQRPAEPWH